MEAWEARNADDRTWRVIDAVRETARAHDVTMSQVALSWLGQRPAVTSVILGARTVDQLVDNLAAADLRLTDDEEAHLSDVSAPVADDYPYGAAGVAQRERNLTGGR